MKISKIPQPKRVELAEHMAHRVMEQMKIQWFSPDDQLETLVKQGVITTYDKAYIRREMNKRLQKHGVKPH